MLDSSPCHFLDVSLVMFTSICSAAVTFGVLQVCPTIYTWEQDLHLSSTRMEEMVQRRRARSRGLHVSWSLFKPKLVFPMFPF